MATRTSKFELNDVTAMDLAFLHLQKWWCYREVTFVAMAMFAVGVMCSAAIGNVVGFIIPAIVAGGVLLGVPESRVEIERWFDRGRSRAFVTFNRIDWPRTCVQLGWSSGSGEQIYVPDLLHLERNEIGETLFVIRPTAQQKPQHWAAMAEQLARSIGAPLHRWEEIEPGVIAIHALMEELPKSINFDASVHTSELWDEIPLGIGVDEPKVVWKPSEVPHLLVAGSTGGGKGSVMRAAIHHALEKSWQVIAINPRASGEFGWAKNIGVPVVSDIENTLKILTGAFEELQRRQIVLEASGVSSWVKLGDQSFTPLMIVVDEAATLLTPNKANKQIAQQQIQIGDYLARIAATGRAVGFHLVVATQRPDANNLGPAGGQLRNNIEARIAVGALDPDGLRMMFTSSDPDVIGGLKGIKGRGLATKLSTGDMDVRPLQVFYLDEADLIRNPPRVAIEQLVMQNLIKAGV